MSLFVVLSGIQFLLHFSMIEFTTPIGTVYYKGHTHSIRSMLKDRSQTLVRAGAGAKK